MNKLQKLAELVEPGKYCLCDYKIYGRPLKICAYCEKKIAPDYNTDLNAMHEVELELKKLGLHIEYGWELKQGTVWSISDAELMFLIATHTAERRCDAAIKVLEEVSK